MSGQQPGGVPTEAGAVANQPEKRSPSPAALIGLLLVLSVAPYLNTLTNGFVYDDNNEILTNPYIRSFRHLGDIFSTRILAHLGARGATNYYRPISILGFLICNKLFGLFPYGFHLANLLLHAMMVCLLFGLGKRLFHDVWLAFWAAAIFALHPIHTESVAWISAVTDLELAVFYVAAFWFFLAGTRPGGGRSEWMQLGMAGTFVLALLSKEQAVTLPLVATAYEHFYRDDRARTTKVQKFERYGVLWLLVIVYVLFRIRFFGAFAPVILTRNVSWYEAILSGFPLTGAYLWKMLWPVHLSSYYGFHKSVSLLDWRVWAGAGAIALCGVAFWNLAKRAPRVAFGFIWFFLTLAPVLNSRWLGPNVFTERYLYLPSVGLCWVAAWWLLGVWAKLASRPSGWQRAYGAALGLVALLAVVRIYTRNRDWRDEVTYYRVALAAEPDAASLRVNLGAVYWNHLQSAEAERLWTQALRDSPDNALLLNNLGLVATGKKDYAGAEDYFRRAMRLRPNFTDAHLNLGRIYEQGGRLTEAELQLRAAVALAPLSVQTRNELGSFYFKNGRWAEAEAQYQASVASIANPAAYHALGDLKVRQGQTQPAEEAYRQAIALDELDSRAQFALAQILENSGRPTEAIRHYEEGLRIDPLNRDAQTALRRLTVNLEHVNSPKK